MKKDPGNITTTTNPRWKSGKRKKYQQRFRAMQCECGICHGRLGPIDYSDSSPGNPLGFVIDEIIPVSKWREGGYNSPSECADDFNNLQPAHRICNGMKSDKIGFVMQHHRNDTYKKKQK